MRLRRVFVEGQNGWNCCVTNRKHTLKFTVKCGANKRSLLAINIQEHLVQMTEKEHCLFSLPWWIGPPPRQRFCWKKSAWFVSKEFHSPLEQR